MCPRPFAALTATPVMPELTSRPGIRCAPWPGGRISSTWLIQNCSRENMDYIDRAGGRFITVLPRTRLETKNFASGSRPTPRPGNWSGTARTRARPPRHHCRRARRLSGKAVAAPTKTEREKDYIAAIAAFYRDNDKLDHRTHAVAYEKAMEQVYLRYPDDREAAVFYALALDTTALPTDKTYANQKKAAEILNKVWKEEPNHPGVVHYLIPSDDSARFAQAGLDAAICYAKIAPDVPHALHMPSHIFTRLGMWQESIDSNLAAEKAAGF